MNYGLHLKSASDLIPSHAEIRAGFVAMAIEKNKKASPFVNEARVLRNRLLNIIDANSLSTDPSIRHALLTAAGISDKALAHLDTPGCDLVISNFINDFLAPSGPNFRDEFVYRFLLTKGDSLGGAIRNLIGVFAQRTFNESFIATLNLLNIAFSFNTKDSNSWRTYNASSPPPNIEDIKAIRYNNSSNLSRLILFNKKVKFVGNNIDIILLDSTSNLPVAQLLNSLGSFLALGELKGGFDPAGADEHWKTAKTALTRISDSFSKTNFRPSLFFIGAAMEATMSSEIFQLLSSSFLHDAANLTKSHQLDALVDWLIRL